jgi:hypothetical protein
MIKRYQNAARPVPVPGDTILPLLGIPSGSWKSNCLNTLLRNPNGFPAADLVPTES